MFEANIKKDTPGFFHVTRSKSLPSIRRRGLSVKPRRKTFSDGEYETLGGIYVSPEDWLAEVINFIGAETGDRDLAVIELSILKGTRFCLDEDEIERMGRLPSRKIDEVYGDDFGPHTRKLVSDSVNDCLVPETDRDQLSVWSCMLARHLDQKQIWKYRLRLFDPPKVVSVRKTTW